MVQVDSQKDFLKILAKVKALASKHPYSEVVDHGKTHEGFFYIQVDGPEQLSDHMASIVTESPRGILKEAKEHKGKFDWASQTYIKDCSTVTFSF